MSLGLLRGIPSISVIRSAISPDGATVRMVPGPFGGLAEDAVEGMSDDQRPPLLQMYRVPSAPNAAPLGPPWVSAYTDRVPSSATRVMH